MQTKLKQYLAKSLKKAIFKKAQTKAHAIGIGGNIISIPWENVNPRLEAARAKLDTYTEEGKSPQYWWDKSSSNLRGLGNYKMTKSGYVYWKSGDSMYPYLKDLYPTYEEFKPEFEQGQLMKAADRNNTYYTKNTYPTVRATREKYIQDAYRRYKIAAEKSAGNIMLADEFIPEAQRRISKYLADRPDGLSKLQKDAFWKQFLNLRPKVSR